MSNQDDLILSLIPMSTGINFKKLLQKKFHTLLPQNITTKQVYIGLWEVKSITATWSIYQYFLIKNNVFLKNILCGKIKRFLIKDIVKTKQILVEQYFHKKILGQKIIDVRK